MRLLGLLFIGCIALAVFQAALPILLLAAAIALLTLILRAPTEALSIIFVLVLLGAVRAQPVVGMIVLAFVVLALVVEA